MVAAESKYFQHEFEIYYQPILRLGEHRVCSFELVLKWQQERQMLYPSSCITLIDQSGLSGHFRNWILQQACHQINVWCQSYAWVVALSLNVHLSSRQFLAPGLTEQLKALKAEYPLAFDSICITLDYEFIIDHFELVNPLIRQLLSLGFQLQINDLYPSHTALHALDFWGYRKVQLSDQFIQAVGTDPQTIEVFMPVIEALKARGTQVLVGGFKAPDQLNLIQQISAPDWSLLCDIPTSATDASHFIDAASKVVPIMLPDYLRAMYKLGSCARRLLGDTIVERYWASTRPDMKWLLLQTPTNLTEIEALNNENLDVKKIALLQFWVERFIQKCCQILPGLVTVLAEESEFTPMESRLMKL